MEKDYSRFQFETLNNLKKHRGQNIKYLPYVFIEEGVAMLSSFLRTEVATKVSINIMRAFVKIRKLSKEGIIEQVFINEMVLKHEKDIKSLQETFNKLEDNIVIQSLLGKIGKIIN